MNNNEMAWLDIISKMYKDLHNTERVLHSSSVSDKRRDRLMKYFNRLEEIHNRVSNSKRKSDELLLKRFYYDLYIIKPENIPESYFENQKRIARERGYGNIEITPEIRKQMIEQVIDDQKESLDKWIEYFLYDEESGSYQMWEKYWVFQGLQTLGKYDKETGKFSKRDKTTIYPFPPVEREYIFTTLKLMEDYIKDKTGDNEIKSALGSGNFKQLYEYVIRQSFLKGEHQSNSTQGKWIKYEQGSNYNVLRDSLQGYYTGWCTAAGENFAKNQLEGGDFYVYYTLDEKGNAKIPRIAIRMNGNYKIEEIRGIANNQNMESEMLSILNEKLKEFPGSDKYFKKKQDMNILTIIDNKANNSIELTLEELRFLYELDDKIEGFGYEKDPRIDEIKSKRNIKKDYGQIYNVNEEEVALSQEEWERNPKKIKVLIGNLYLRSLTSAEDLTLPQIIGGDLDLLNLTSTEGLVIPQSIGDSLDLRSLTSAKGLVLPQSINGGLYLNNLTNAEGLILPQSIGWTLDLRSLTSAEDLTLPQIIGGSLDLSSLTSAKDLNLPQSIGFCLDLRSLTSTEGLILPQSIDYLDLNNLTSAEGLILPQSIDSLDLSGLTSAKGLVLPQSIDGYLILSSLTSAEGLILPYDFDINKLYCPKEIKEEIMSNPDKYFMKAPDNEKEKRKVKIR